METTGMENRIHIMMPLLDERQRRIFLAAEAQSYGRGGITLVSKISGVAPFTIRQGISEINCGEQPKPSDRIRAVGAGRKSLEESMPDPSSRTSRGHMNTWTGSSVRMAVRQLRGRC